MAETWVLNESLSLLDYNGSSWTINFTSNNTNYSQLNINAPAGTQRELYYGPTSGAYVYDFPGGWIDEAYKTIVFETAPTGTLLTWLQANGTKQSEPATPKVYRMNSYKQSIGGIIASLFDTSDRYGNFSIYVKAVSRGFIDSSESNIIEYTHVPATALPAPTGVTISGDTLGWIAVANAANYEIYVQAEGATNVTRFAITSSNVITVNLKDFSSSYNKLHYDVVYNVYVKAIAGSSGYMDSALSTDDVTFSKTSGTPGGGGEEDYYILYGGLYKVVNTNDFDGVASVTAGKDILINCIIIDGSSREIKANYYDDNLWSDGGETDALYIGSIKVNDGDLIYTGFSGQKITEDVKTWILAHMQEVVCDSNDNYIVPTTDSYTAFTNKIPEYSADADKQFAVRFGDYSNVLIQNGWTYYVYNDNRVMPIEQLSVDVSTEFGPLLFNMVRILPSLHGNFPSENLFNLQQTLQDETGYVDEGWQFFTAVYENVNDIYIAKDEPDLSTFDSTETNITLIDTSDCYISLYTNLANVNYWFYSSYQDITNNGSTWNSNIIVTSSSVKLTDISADVETKAAATAWYTNNSWKASTFNVAAYFVNRVIAKRTGEFVTSDDIDKLFEKTYSQVISVREQLYIKF